MRCGWLLLAGWPSFYAPVDPDHVVEIVDRSIPWMPRVSGACLIGVMRWGVGAKGGEMERRGLEGPADLRLFSLGTAVWGQQAVATCGVAFHMH
jgi:hypothetical protein